MAQLANGPLGRLWVSHLLPDTARLLHHHHMPTAWKRSQTVVTRDLPKGDRGQAGVTLAIITTKSGLLIEQSEDPEKMRESVCVLGGMVVVRHNSWGPCGLVARNPMVFHRPEVQPPCYDLRPVKNTRALKFGCLVSESRLLSAHEDRDRHCISLFGRCNNDPTELRTSCRAWRGLGLVVILFFPGGPGPGVMKPGWL